MRVRYHEDAREDLRSAVHWYEEQRATIRTRPSTEHVLGNSSRTRATA